MNGAWQDRVRQFGEAGTDATKKLKHQIESSAPDVSRRMRNRIEATAPVVAHKAREVSKALASRAPDAPVEAPESRQLPDLSPAMNSDDTSLTPSSEIALKTPNASKPLGVAQSAIARPVSVHIAYLALIAAAVGSATLAGLGVYGLTQVRGDVEKVMQLDRTGTVAMFARSYVDNTEETLMSSAVGLGIVFGLCYLLVAFAIRRGHRWPRPVSSILAVFSVPIIFLGPYGLGIFVAGIVAVFALWTRTARQYTSQLKSANKITRV